MILLLLTLFNWNNFIYSAQFYPGYYPQGMMPMYPPGMMPPVPYHYPPYYPSYPPPPMMMPPMMPQQGLNGAPGADAIAALLNPPSQQGASASEYNFTAQLPALQLPLSVQQSTVPLSLLNANVPSPMSSQVGSTLNKVPASNEPEKTAPLPILY